MHKPIKEKIEEDMDILTNKIDSENRRLAHKLYLFSIGLYAAVASIFGFLYLFNSALGLNQLLSVFIGYFITVLWRSFYDQTMIHEVRARQITMGNNVLLALMSASVLAFLYHFLRTPLGDWAIPIVLVISMRIMARVKNIFWPNSSAGLSAFFKRYVSKVQAYAYGLYGFFVAVALMTFYTTKAWGITYFYLTFAGAVFVALIVEQLYEVVTIYETEPTTKMIMRALGIAFMSAIFCSGAAFALMQAVGLSGKAATIISIVVTKLVQPLATQSLLTASAEHDMLKKG